MKKIRLLLLFFMMMIIGIGGVKGIIAVTDNYKYYLKSDGEISVPNELSGRPLFTPKAWIKGEKVQSDLSYDSKLERCQTYKVAQNYKTGCSSYSDDNDRIISEYVWSDTAERERIKKNTYIIYKNVGYYNGVPIHMKISIDDIGFNYNNGTWDYVSVGFNNGKSIGVRNNSKNFAIKVKYKIEFLQKENNGEYKIFDKDLLAAISFVDMDYKEDLWVYYYNISRAYRYDITEKGNTLNHNYDHIKITSDNSNIRFTPSQDVVLTCKSDYDTYVDSGYKNWALKNLATEVDCSVKENDYIYKKYKRYQSYYNNVELNGMEYDDDFFRRAGTLTVLFDLSKSNKYINKNTISFWWSGFYTGLEDVPFAKLIETKPIKYVNKKDVNLNNTNEDGKIKYTINLYVPKQDKKWYYSEWKIIDNISNYLTVDSVEFKRKKYDGNNYDDYSEFIVSNGVSNNIVEISVNNSILDNSDFYGREYQLVINASIKDEYKDSKEKVKFRVSNFASHTYKFKNYKKANDEPYSVKSNIVYTNVYKEKATCESELEKIKKSGFSKVQKLVDLFELYKDYPNFNKLLNIDDNLNIDGAECSTLTCSASTGDNLSCFGENEIKSLTAQGANDRVCYLDPSYGKDENLYKDLDAFCNVNYTYKLPFKDEEVKSGMLLWQKDTKELGNVKVNFHCENVYDSENYTLSTIKSGKINAQTLFKNLNLKVSISNDDNYSNLSVSNVGNSDVGANKVECISQSGKEYCYISWDGSFNYNLNYSSDDEWFSVDPQSGKVARKGSLDSSKLNLYKKLGFGLPTSLIVNTKISLQSGSPYYLSDNKIYKNENAILSISSNLLDDSVDIECPYTMYIEFSKPEDDCIGMICRDPYLTGNPNIGFRIIDKNNPFPGILGNWRKTGSNWCWSENIGKNVIDNGNHYIVGDINGDGKLDSGDWQVSKDKFEGAGLLVADVNGDGIITYDSGCTAKAADNCRVMSYVTNANCFGKAADNCRVMSYVTNANCFGKAENNQYVAKNISNRNDSWSTSKPMYSFTLTPEDIHSIRKYNEAVSYATFYQNSNFTCDNGEKCLSKYLTSVAKNYINIDESACYDTRYNNGNWCSNSDFATVN